MWPVETFNFLFSLGAIFLQATTAAMLAVYILRARYAWCASVVAFVSRYAMLVGMYFAAAVVASSLFYSEVLGVLPCGLCWLQRVFLYPQMVLFGVAVWKRERVIADYSIVLSAFGAVVALYHHYLQMGGGGLLPCPAVQLAADCFTQTFLEFGYVTLPLIGFTSCVFLIVLMLYTKRGDSEK